MNTINIEKRMAERLAMIRKAAAALPASGKRNQILNNCDKLAILSRKAGAQLATAHTSAPHRALYDAATEVDMAARETARKRVFAALIAGRTLSIENAEEFAGKNGTTQMHTIFCKIRQEIEDKGLPYILCDEWVHPGDGRCKFKRYHLEHILEGEGVL